METNESHLSTELMKFIVGKWVSKPIYAAAELCIADLLAEGPKSIEDLSMMSRTHAPSLYRLMRALASVGIFSEAEGRRFELTPMAELLKTGVMRSIALMFNSSWNDQAWKEFTECLRTGETAFEKAHGMPVSKWLEKNPGAAKIFNEANALKAANTHRSIIDVYDFKEISTLIDVGGGLGVLLAEILNAYSSMNGVLAETPSVVAEAKEIIRAHGIEDRCKRFECDFFESVPSGGDAYILSNILHDWTDEQCKIILKNCHRAMKAKSKLLIVEMVIPPGNGPSVAKLLDLEMFVITGGRERTEGEFKDLFSSSGFELSRVIPTRESICIIEGIRL
ncbi:methyltransferase [Thermodesulfobacteriota bacterium]